MVSVLAQAGAKQMRGRGDACSAIREDAVSSRRCNSLILLILRLNNPIIRAPAHNPVFILCVFCFMHICVLCVCVCVCLSVYL